MPTVSTAQFRQWWEGARAAAVRPGRSESLRKGTEDSGEMPEALYVLKLQSPHFQGTLRGASTGTCMGISDSKCIEVAQRAGLSTPDLQDSREPCPREASQCLPVLWALCWTARELRSLAKS